jgi:hypothetical protein
MARKASNRGLHRPNKTKRKKNYAPYNTEEYGVPTSPLSEESKKTAIGYGKFQEMGTTGGRKSTRKGGRVR